MQRLNSKIFLVSVCFFYLISMTFGFGQNESNNQPKLDSLLKIIENKPTAEAYYSLGEIYISRKRLEAAKDQFILCIQTDANSPFRTQAHLQIGRIEYLSKNYAKAIRELRKALELQPELIEALNLMRVVQNMEAAEKAFIGNDLIKAESHYREVIKVDAANQLARERLHIIQNRHLADNFIKSTQDALSNHQYDKARFYLDDVEKVWPDHPLFNTLKKQIAQEVRALDSITRAKSFTKTQIKKIQAPDSEQIKVSLKSPKIPISDSLLPDTSQIDSADLASRIADKTDQDREKAITEKLLLATIGAFAALILILIGLRFFRKYKPDKLQVEGERAESLPEESLPGTEPKEKESRPSSESSRFIDKYEIIESLTRGGMGQVVKARHPHFHKPVVLKSILPELTHITTFKQRLIREANILFELDHPNIVRVYDLLEKDDLIFIVMQFIEGMNLKEMLEAQGALKLPKVLNYFIQTCQALNYLHGRKIIHRDIKPQNIMVETVTENVKLVDFGIVKPLDSELSQTITSSSRIVGTPNYMSPEQLLNDEIDYRTDIFSSGIVFFEVLTGQHPFYDSDMSITHAILEKTAPPITDVNPTLNKNLIPVCEKMLAKNRKERYQSVQEIIRDLELIT